MILGVTTHEDGTPIQRLTVAVKISIGVGPTEQRNHPEKLDHFLLQRKVKRGKEVEWEPDPELHAIYGDEPGKPSDWYVQNGKIKEVGVILLDDDIENVFPTKYAWYSQKEVRCQGELVQIEPGKWTMQAQRRVKAGEDFQPWPANYKYSTGDKKGQPVEPCGDGCPDLEAGRCKPSADLRVTLDRMPIVGATARLHTTSYRSIRQLHASLQQIRKMTGGRLTGVPAMLRVRPEKMAYTDEKGKHTTIVYVLSLEISARDVQKLVASVTESAQLFMETRKLLGTGKLEVVEEDDELRAREIAAEFYPDTEAVAPEQELLITETQWKEMWAVGRASGRTNEEIVQVIAGIHPGIMQTGSDGFVKAKTKDLPAQKYDQVIEALKVKKGADRPPKAQIPQPEAQQAPEPQPEPEVAPAPAPEPNPGSVEAPVAPASQEAEEAPPAAPPKPKTMEERAKAIAEAVGVDLAIVRKFCAKECGVEDLKKAKPATVKAVLVAIEKMLDDAKTSGFAPEALGKLVRLDKDVPAPVAKMWNGYLYDETKAAKK